MDIANQLIDYLREIPWTLCANIGPFLASIGPCLATLAAVLNLLNTLLNRGRCKDEYVLRRNADTAAKLRVALIGYSDALDSIRSVGKSTKNVSHFLEQFRLYRTEFERFDEAKHASINLGVEFHPMFKALRAVAAEMLSGLIWAHELMKQGVQPGDEDVRSFIQQAIGEEKWQAKANLVDRLDAALLDLIRLEERPAKLKDALAAMLGLLRRALNWDFA